MKSPVNMHRVAAGFTLVEVLVAVAVLAIALSAVIGAMAQQAKNAGYLRDKTLAVLVAHNRLAELQLEQELPATGRSDGEVQMSGVEWTWRAQVTETEDPYLNRVDLEVQMSTRPDAVLATLTGFLPARR